MTATMRDGEPIIATATEVLSLREIERQLSASSELPTRLVIADNDGVELPESVAQVLRMVVRHLADNEAVAIVPIQKEMTTQQAADLLNISRPSLIELLDRGDVPFHRVGTHRRVRFDDLMTYKRVRDQERREGLRQLTRMSQRLGLYDRSDSE